MQLLVYVLYFIPLLYKDVVSITTKSQSHQRLVLSNDKSYTFIPKSSYERSRGNISNFSKSFKVLSLLGIVKLSSPDLSTAQTNEIPSDIRNQRFVSSSSSSSSLSSSFQTTVTQNPNEIISPFLSQKLEKQKGKSKDSILSRNYIDLNQKVSTIQSSSIITNVAQVERNANEDFVRGLVSGAASRASKELLLHPIDTIRARQQVPYSNSIHTNDNINNTTVLSIVKTIIDLYSGVGPALVGGIPAGAVFFGVKDYSKNKLKKIGYSKEVATILSVGIANIPYWLIRTPAEALKTRQQVKEENNSNITELYRLYQSQGINALFQSIYGSYLSNYVYALPADVIKFLAYEVLKDGLYSPTYVKKIQGLEAGLNGAIAGLVAQAITTPLDVARTRIMLQPSVNDTNDRNQTNGNKFEINPVVTMIDITNKEGFEALTSGIVPRSLRAIGSGAIQFASIEGSIKAIFGS